MLHQVPPGCDAHPEARAPVLPTTRSDASNTAYSAPYTAVRYRLPYKHHGPSSPDVPPHPLLILTHNDGWQPQAHIAPPPMRCLAQTSRASQGRRNTVGAHPPPPLPQPSLPHLFAPRPPPSALAPLLALCPSVKGKKDTYLFPAELPSFARPPPPESPPPRSLSPSLLSFFPPSTAPSHCHPKNRALLYCPSPFLFQLTNSPTARSSSHPHHDGPQEKAGGGGAGLTP